MKGFHQKVPDPSPQDIRKDCEEIRALWSEKKHRKRAGEISTRWTAPSIDEATVIGAINDDRHAIADNFTEE